MAETSEVLANVGVQTAMLDLIANAAIAYGVKPQHAREMGGKYVAIIAEGAPVPAAIALVDAIDAVHWGEDEEDDDDLGDDWEEDEEDLDDLEDDDA